MKKLVSIITAFLIISPFANFTADNSVVHAATVNKPAEVYISDVSCTTLSSNLPATLSITVNNNTAADISDAYIRLSDLSSDGIYVASIISNSTYDSEHITIIAAGTQHTYLIPLRAAASATIGTQTLKASIRSGAAEIKSAISIGVVISAPAKPADPVQTVEKSLLKLTDFSIPSSVTPESTFNVSFNVKNIGNVTATDISIVADVSADTFNYSSSSTSQINNIGAGGNQYVTLYLKASSKLKTGAYPLTIKYSYTDDKYEDLSGTQTIYISVTNSSTSSGFLLQNAGIPEGIAKPSLLTNLEISYQNALGTDAKNVKVQLSGFADKGATLNTFTDTLVVGNVAKDGEFIVKFPIRIDAKPNKSISLVATVTCDGAEPQVFNVFLTSTVAPDDPSNGTDTNKSKPRVIFSNYDLDVDNVLAGKNFNFSFTLLNTSTVTNVKNMKVSISQADGIYVPVEGSSSFYTPSLGKNATSSYSILLSAKAAAESKSYPITISIEYEDMEANNYTVTETVNILLTQPVKFEIADFYCDPQAFINNPLAVRFNYFNKGKAALNDFSISIEGDFTAPAQYIGSLAGSSYDSYETAIMPTEPGSKSGIVVCTFEDATGTPQRFEQPFSVEVMEGGDMFDPGMGGELPTDLPIDDPSKSNSIKLWQKIALIIVGCAGTATVGFIVVKKVIVKKRAAKIEDDDDDDIEE